MDPQQDLELDNLIAAVDGETPEDTASAAEPEADTRETAEPDDSSQDESGDVDEGGDAEGEDGEEPEESEEYEVNAADLSPIQQQVPEGSLAELAQLREQVRNLEGFQTQTQQEQEKARFAGFLESLKGMDPDERKDAVASQIANWAMSLQQQLNARNQRDQLALEQRALEDAKSKTVQFIAMGGRRTEDGRLVVNKRLALSEAEAQRLAKRAARGLDPLGLEEFATELVEDRRARAGNKRSQKQQADARIGASRTLAGAGAARPAPKNYGTGEEGLDNLLDDLFK
jgi:hypothetical protein